MNDDEEEEEDEDEDDGRDRLFEALNGYLDLDRIRSIVEAHPGSVRCDPDPETNGGWCSALHMVIGAAGDRDEVQYVAQHNPHALQTRDRYGRLPLHLAVMYRARLPVVKMLAEMYPQALQEPIADKSGCTCLCTAPF